MNRSRLRFANFIFPVAGPIWHFAATLILLALVVPALWLLLKAGVKKRSLTPSVVFGATPIINSKYHSQALRAIGLDSMTVVRHYLSHITRSEDFDVRFGAASPNQPRLRRWYARLLQVYVEFIKLLWNRDVFFYYFDGFYLLQGGPLQWLELQSLKLLGKRIVVMPYGGDVVTAADIPDVARKYANVRQYPSTATNERLVHRQVRYFSRWADAIIGGGATGPDHLPRIDYLCPSHFAINGEEWPPHYGPPRNVGEPFRILHAPNHRHIKGTQFLTSAIEQLKVEGLNIQLVLLEGVPNSEVKKVMAKCHVLAEQFIQGWHGLNGLEGMASGKPVLCYLRPDLLRLYQLYSFGNDCPIVNTPIEAIGHNLRWLYFHPEECERIGRQGRVYVERYHSFVAMGGFLAGMIYHLYDGSPFDANTYWKQRAETPVAVTAGSQV